MYQCKYVEVLDSHTVKEYQSKMFSPSAKLPPTPPSDLKETPLEERPFKNKLTKNKWANKYGTFSPSMRMWFPKNCGDNNGQKVRREPTEHVIYNIYSIIYINIVADSEDPSSMMRCDPVCGESEWMSKCQIVR